MALARAVHAVLPPLLHVELLVAARRFPADYHAVFGELTRAGKASPVASAASAVAAGAP